MSSAATIIRSVSEWQVYCCGLAQQHGLQANQVAWGSGPQAYPCLVASIRVSDLKFSTCYIYAHDAEKLIKATDASLAPTLCATAPVAPPAPQQPVSAEQANLLYKLHMTALMFTIISEMETVSITGRERFEQAFTRNLAMVEQFHAGQRDGLGYDLNKTAQGFALQKLLPDQGKQGAQ